jgi:hypothetical protein
MMDGKRSVAGRRPLLSDDAPRTDPAAVGGAENSTRDDIWVTSFVSRLTGTLRDIASRKQK